MLSVIIITKNEEKKIRDCLESVKWADEIVVVDAGSEDRTVQICKEYATIVVTEKWTGFGPQKNKALALAKGDWILSIDADERITDELQDEILQTVAHPADHNAFEIPRHSNYCGRFMKYSGWYPDYVLRLFKKDSGKFSDDLVHEKVVVAGKTGKLATPIRHYSFDNLDQVIQKMNDYSSLSAENMHLNGKSASLGKAVGRGFWTFFRTYILRLGFLDGKEGLMLAISNAEGTYYKYAKLALKNKHPHEH
ncbi:MAG TPA: glycosyltransferase family 2 protein [Chromatiales bacterium]|nr:glycosyltransferase family 2 protein [Thiotrichales bacterium]HIP67707.1 glycosyltransferase family 2 protein [Chromatiales bacterium]